MRYDFVLIVKKYHFLVQVFHIHGLKILTCSAVLFILLICFLTTLKKPFSREDFFFFIIIEKETDQRMTSLQIV